MVSTGLRRRIANKNALFQDCTGQIVHEQRPPQHTRWAGVSTKITYALDIYQEFQ